MKLLSTYLRGKSLTVCFAFPEAYDMANIDDLNVSIGSKQFTGDDIDISGKVACVRLKSEDTYKLTGDYPIIISIDDKTRGVIPIDVGDIRFVTHRNTLNNASTNEENDIVVALSITQTTIDVDSVLYDVMAGKAATIEVGTVTTLEAGEDATIENTGTENEAVFNFGIPKGDKGDKGDAGDMFSGQFNTVILKQNCTWVDGWLWIDTGSKTHLKIIEVGYFAINTGIGTEYLKPIVHYPAGLTYQTSSVPNGFYLKDMDGRLSENTDFEFLDVRYNILSDTVAKYDGLTKLNGINAAFDDFDVSHSAAMRTIFLQIYQGFIGEVYRSATDELCNFSRIDAHFEPTYARIRNVDVIGIPIVNAGAMEQSGSNADILKVASHYNNTFARVDITADANTFINNVIAIGSCPDEEIPTTGTSYGFGLEFFEDTIKTSSEYPNFNYASWNPTYQQSATTAIITAKFRMIKDATGASWDIIRRACRATARKTVGGVYAAGFPWDMYRGFGVIDVDAAIDYIKANYTENEDYLNNLADEVERTRGIDPMLPYDKQTDDTPIAKRDFEPVRDKLAGIEDNANNYVHPATHPPEIIEQDANNRFVTDAEKSTWTGKQNDLGFTPENAANKTQTLTDSETDYPSGKAVTDAIDETKMVTDARVTTLENVISSANINQETTATVTGVDTVSLPKTAANTGMQVQMFGQSAENLVVNGDFRNGTTGYLSFNASLSVVGGNLINTAGSIENFGESRRDNVFSKDNIFYLKSRFRVTNSNATSARVLAGDSAVRLNVTHPVANQWYELSVVGLHESTDSRLLLRHLYANAATANGAVMEVDYVLGVNLTATFGAGNEPTKEQCNKLFANYFEGTDNVLGTGRVRSVDADGLNPSILQLTTPPLRSNGLIKDEIRKGTNGYELVKRVGVGTLGANGITGGDFEGGLVATVTDGFNSVSTWTLNTTNPISGLQDGRLQVNTIGTSHARPFLAIGTSRLAGQFRKVSFAYKVNSGTCVLSSFSSGPSTVNVNKTLSGNGLYEAYYIASGNNSLALYFDGRNLFDLQIDNIKDELVNTLEGAATGAVATVLGNSIHYTLATPVITPIAHAGLLNSNSNGTVYFEPAVADAGVYGTNLAIQLTDFPINTIESISKYENGVFTTLNPATAVIASGGLSFTHPDLASGDLVTFTYMYNLESTGRSMTLTHYDSRYVVKDTANTNVYKITPKITSGLLTWELTLV